MIYVLWGRTAFNNDSRRDNAVSRIQSYLATPAIAADLFAPAQVGPYDGAYKGWPHALNFDARFLTQATRDDLWNQVDSAFGSGVNGPVGQSLIERFDSNADDASNPDQSKQNTVTRAY